MKKYLFKLSLILALVMCSSIAFSQPPPPTNPNCWPPPCTIPFDGGVSFLIAAGVAYGSKKLYDANKKNP